MVILDLLMPVESGWKLINFIKADEKYKDMPIIALTGLSLSYEEFEKVKEQCNDVMLKGDFEIERFTSKVYELLMG